MTAPARLANAFSSSRTAGISFDFASTAAWPRTAPMPCASAATRCDQVRGLPRLVLRAADGLAVDRDHQPAAGLHRPGVQPGTENPVEHIGADQCEGTSEGGLLRRAAGRAQYGQHLRAGIGGPLPDRGERPRSRDHRRDPHGQQPGQRVPAPAPLPRVRDLGKEIEQVLAAGSRDRRRCHRRAGSLAADDGERRNFHRSARAPPAARGHAGPINRRYGTRRSQPQFTTLPRSLKGRGEKINTLTFCQRSS